MVILTKAFPAILDLDSTEPKSGKNNSCLQYRLSNNYQHGLWSYKLTNDCLLQFLGAKKLREKGGTCTCLNVAPLVVTPLTLRRQRRVLVMAMEGQSGEAVDRGLTS